MGSINPGSTQDEGIPFWQVNVPESQRTADCPPFLAHLSPKDCDIIGTPDANFTILSWSAVQLLTATNRLDLFERLPSNLRRYLEYNHGLKARHGSIMAFILTHRLHWEAPVRATAPPFQNPDDLRILRNDWPYGVAPGIVHLVVWTKFSLDADPETDDLTDTARREIEEYVNQTFTSRVGADNVRSACLFP